MMVQKKLNWLYSFPHFLEKIDVLNEAADKKFRILILIDLEGTLLYRCPYSIDAKHDFEYEGVHYFFRPGYADTLTSLIRHPRSSVAFYSSMTQKAIVRVTEQLLSEDEDGDLEDQISVFDWQYCPEMAFDERLAELAQD